MLMASQKRSNKEESRRNFIQSGLKCGAGALFLSATATSCKKPKEKVKALTQDGQLVEIDKPDEECCKPATPEEARTLFNLPK